MSDYIEDEVLSEYITKEQALDIIAENNEANKMTLVCYDDLVEGIYNSPAADVRENAKAQWIIHSTNLRFAHCSNCGTIRKVKGICKTGEALIHYALYKFCPICGAKMKRSIDEVKDS